MENTKRKHLLWLIMSALCCVSQKVESYFTLIGNGTVPGTTNGTTFAVGQNGIVTGHTYFPLSEIYLGLFNGNGDYAVCYGALRTAMNNSSLIPLATDPALTNKFILALATVQNSANIDSPTIVALVRNSTVLQAISKINTTAVQSPIPHDPAGNPNGGIVYAHCAYTGLPNLANVTIIPLKVNGAANAGVPFGAGAGGTTGTNTDGISAAYVTQTSAGAPVWDYVGANGTTNVATPFDLTATGSYLIPNGNTLITGLTGSNFHVDAAFQRFYVTIQATVVDNADGLTKGLYGVGIYPITTNGQTVTVGPQLAPCGSTDTVSVNNSIIGYKQNAAATTSAVNDIAVMHTSTGMGYLILNGNTIAANTVANAQQIVANQVYAVPLVNGDPGNPAVGCFANVNSATRTVIATNAGDLITTASPAALVGGTGILPITNSLLNGQTAPNAIQIVSCDGDAVIMATGGSNPASSINEPGLWISRAIFNDFGQIDHWTDWQKVAPNEMGGNSANGVASDGSDPRVTLATVDAYTGYVVTYNAASLKVNASQWTKPITNMPNSQEYLAAAVNNALNDQCYSVLDLNSSVTCWGASNPTVLTLFGGNDTVCFAITGSRGAANPQVNGTYTSINNSISNSWYDYTSTATFFTSSLPSGAGAVVALGFSGWNFDTQTGANVGFFFAGCAGTAGTAPGLYVYTNGGNGFNPLTVGTTTHSIMADLGLIPIGGAAASGAWTKVTTVTGMPIKIQGEGGRLHVLTRSATGDKIYSCPKQSTVTGLIQNFAITAASGAAPVPGSPASSLVNVKQIYDFVVSVSAAPSGATPAVGNEQLLMLTSDGMYTSSSTIGMQSYSGNLNQLTAGWQLIDETSAIKTTGYFSNYIQIPAYTRSPQTFCFANYVANPALINVYNQNSEYQISRQSFPSGGVGGTLHSNAIAYSNLPLPNFNGTTSLVPTAATSYQNFPVLARCFYNDGVRRYFIQKNPADDSTYQVVVLPYNLYDYGIGTSGKAPMEDTVVVEANAFYWMSMIGDTGRLMMGTSNGVLSLQ